MHRVVLVLDRVLAEAVQDADEDGAVGGGMLGGAPSGGGGGASGASGACYRFAFRPPWARALPAAAFTALEGEIRQRLDEQPR